MKVYTKTKKSFTVIGKLGSTNSQGNWIENLWREANSSFHELNKYIKRDENGAIVGIWGAMSDMSGKFLPWEDNYSKGLYLAGVEVVDDAYTPLGWHRFKIPTFKYEVVKVDNNYKEVMQFMLNDYLPKYNLKLVGAIQEFYNFKENMQLYLYFPIERIEEE